jgi:hypothetical protein
MRKGAAMRCQSVDNDLQCRFDATRRFFVSRSVGRPGPTVRWRSMPVWDRRLYSWRNG